MSDILHGISASRCFSAVLLNIRHCRPLRRRAILLLLAVFAGILSAPPAAAFDWSGWLSEAAVTSYNLRTAILKELDREGKEFNDRLNQEARVSPPYPLEILMQEPPQCGLVSFRLGDAVFPLDRKFDAKTYKNCYFAVRYSFPLTRDMPFMLKVGTSALAVFHNGEPLNYVSGSFWGRNYRCELNGKSGENVIVVFPEHTISEVPSIQVFPDAAAERVGKILTGLYAGGLQPKQTKQLARFLLRYAEDSTVNGRSLGEAFVAWAEFIKQQVPEDGKSNQSDLLYETANEAMCLCKKEQKYFLHSKLQEIDIIKDFIDAVDDEKEKPQEGQDDSPLLSPDPKAEQYFAEFTDKLQQKEPAPETFADICRLFRQYGSVLRKTPQGLRALRLEMIDYLQQQKLYDKAAAEAERCLQSEISQAEKKRRFASPISHPRKLPRSYQS